MGTHYSQLGLKERFVISQLHEAGLSIRMIGEQIGRCASTISRELRRNAQIHSSWQGGYDPERAMHLAARRRRWDKRFKLLRQPDLQRLVKQRLAMGHSPAQIVGRLTLDAATMTISHESIYRFIEHRIAQKDYSWHRLLPKAKYYRGRRRKKGGPPSKTFKHYVSIEQRPQEIASRKTPGHWEADLMAFRQNTQVMLIVHDRMSRKIFATRQPNKGAEAVRDQLCKTLGKLPKTMRKSITYDNGTEFARHHEVNQRIHTQSYFCHTHSPWEKGGVENAIGRLRRFLPRKTNLDTLKPNAIQKWINIANNTPRKCLGYLTPNEAFAIQVKGSTVALQT